MALRAAFSGVRAGDTEGERIMGSTRRNILRNITADQHFLRFFLSPDGMERVLVAGFILLGLGAVWALVAATGIYVYVHVAYLPIFLGALFFGWPGGVVVGVMAGLAVGPLVPHDPVVPSQTVPLLGDGTPALGEPVVVTDDLGWVFRTIAFTAIGGIAGLICSTLRRLTHKMLHRGYLDATTGLPNVQYMTRVLNAMVASGGTVSVHVVKVNALRMVVTAFGARIASRMMRRIASRLDAALPDDHLLFKLDEASFGVIGPGGVERVLREALEEPVKIAEIPLIVDATVGWVEALANKAHIQEALRQASLAAEEAYDEGALSGRYRKRTEKDRQKSIRILAEFRNAVAEGQLFLVFQPKVRLADGHMTGCEALVRWSHPERGLIPPGQFIPVVERSSLIHQMTRAVLEQAIRQIAAWNQGAAARIPVPVSVNMSARDLSNPELIDTVVGLLRETGVDPELLDIELTESAAFQQGADVKTNLHRLRDAGIGLSIDDYGTGLSSLYYLREIPATTLKIDREFVGNLCRDESNRLLVRSTIDLCRAMGLGTVGEGVEDKETSIQLQDLGCDSAQGYFFAKPLAPDDLAAYYRAADSGLSAGAFAPAPPRAAQAAR